MSTEKKEISPVLKAAYRSRRNIMLLATTAMCILLVGMTLHVYLRSWPTVVVLGVVLLIVTWRNYQDLQKVDALVEEIEELDKQLTQ